MKIETFDPAVTPLRTGVSLIEASAGTGKTYAIAKLVLRLVVELNIPVSKVLVVTFTKAATEELKARIRSRLAETRKILTGANVDSNDQTITAWINKLELSRTIVLQRLRQALLEIDQAGIFTIHGFCQRVLTEHALASGQLFDAELTEDIDAIERVCVDDFWRRHVQKREPWELAVLMSHFPTPDALLNSIGQISDEALILPELSDLDAALMALQQSAGNAKTALAECQRRLQSGFVGKKFKDSYQNQFQETYELINRWLNGQSHFYPGVEVFSLLTANGLCDGLNGIKFLTTKTQTSEQRKNDYLNELKINTQPFDELAANAKAIPLILRRQLAETLPVELDRQLEQSNTWSFDNVLTHLANALKGDQVAKLMHELRQRFQAALIDEFQDTDNKQWHIFSKLFAADSHYLMMVGDPKQAIYKFRGADIYSYLEAQRQAQFRYTLVRNWRSHPRLVAAVNYLFQKENAFFLPEINFLASQAALTEQDGALTHNGNNLSPMMLWQLPESGGANGYWQAGQAGQLIRTSVVNEIVELLTGAYTMQPENRKVLPKDIAILVRRNRQAREYQEALRSASVLSVLNSTESVFSSQEASQLYTLLEAIAHPGDLNYLGQALALNLFGFDGQALYRLLNSETEIEAFLTRFLGYYQLWRQKGVLTMMQSLLQQEAVVKVIATGGQAERRLTNLQHVLELLQQAVIDHRLGIHKTINWLKTAITESNNKSTSPENQQLRLESDADAVTIITMHRAKGLEYPIVFCPCLWQSGRDNNHKNPLVQCHAPDTINGRNNRSIVDLGSDRLELHQKQARFEERAEDVRLAYVALTRAKYRCYLAWANVRTQEKSNESALAGLLGLGEKSNSEQQIVLQQLATEYADAFSYRLLENPIELNNVYSKTVNPTALSAKQRRRSVYTTWQMSSYTALSSHGISDTPELPADKAGELYAPAVNHADGLPAGAHTGNVAHELLENIHFGDLAEQCDITEARNLACHRFGLKLVQPELINDLLLRTVTTPLSKTDSSFLLMNLQENQCLKEMPFYLHMAAFNTREVNKILRREPAFQPLNYQQMSGFLTGFIDLVCEYKGKFYVMDYKTNSLPDYGEDALIQAMREHNYGLQYWLYCVVLHRYLTHRRPNYRYADHFGGVRYLFVRGMQPDIAMSGVFAATPELEVLDALSALFGS
ncbi:MAG: exodeoxyribonuclease V subunit beta [Gammaproteobacteria bacterium]|nr:exodeoxyribonuclease V subunit beta [Gammaproteobacteria bacterium]